MFIKLIARFLIVIFVMFFSICGHCIVIKAEHYNDHEYIAKTVLVLLSKKGLTGRSRNDELIPWQCPPGTDVTRIKLVFDKVKGRYFLDVENSQCRYNLGPWGFQSQPGQVFELEEVELINQGEYFYSQDLFEHDVADRLKLYQLDEIFTIEGGWFD